jgi:MoxR-like ATPase
METETTAGITELETNISRVLLGKPEVVRLAVVTLLAEGHLLIEDVPGVGKTLLAKALARSVAGSFRRIQFTPDLLPSDIVGSSIFNAQTSQFSFRNGPIFANVVLADEINRTPPRTQSALLEAMNDGQVTVEGETHPLPRPFLVLATQNPYEFEGTYLLPESQLDRFMMCLRIGYPDREQEKRVLREHRTGEPVEHLEPVLDGDHVRALQRQVREVRVDDAINDYLMDVVTATRECDELAVGVSPRGALNLYRASQSLALVEGRDYVTPDDVKQLAVPALSHRIIFRSYKDDGRAGSGEELIRRLLQEIPVPT